MNKDRLNKAIDKDINPNDYYDEIVKKIEKVKIMKRKNNIWKLSIIPICIVLIICVSLLSNKFFNKRVLIESNNNLDNNININNIDGEVSTLDIDIKTVDGNYFAIPIPYKENATIIYPKDLSKYKSYIIFTRENKESNEYNILNSYILDYINDNDRMIRVAYSKDNKPIRDYYFNEKESKTTIINDIELQIYQYKSNYYVAFYYNDYNFDIETLNITEEELINFLQSILI